MRRIAKGSEPKSLTEYRLSPGAKYDDYPDKQTLRESLVAEQRGICCYCMSRIDATPEKMKIEHWQSQSHFPERQLDYSNLLGACDGGIGQPPQKQHCDTRKGDRNLSRNPADPRQDVERGIRYLKNGRIESKDPDFQREIDEVLNLNVHTLVQNRRAVFEGLIDYLEKLKRREDWNKPFLEKQLQEWNGQSSNEPLKPFCQVVVYWLRDRLARG